ncbi:MAG TPA: bifunctional 4-hydroxy-3-methylbut-2-enyl diphosphate reductase/30S ribosomal protein S1 [Ruminococcaceae bacterium]|nr:bifunctional 4-hydroxy-3-methylbut-2-enyl diphosphate reductase/30S ribosomal protein S1 [Oscillospiraceae bacterium]
MKIEVAKTAGFCFGVDRVVSLVEKLLDEGRRVCTLGEIIHNPQIVRRLTERGVVTLEEPRQTPHGSVLVIRSHGIPAEMLEKIKASKIEYRDATCPYVRKIHTIVERASKNGAAVLIAGDESHPELIGIRGYCAGDSYIFGSEHDLEKLIKTHPELHNKPVVAVAQTTFHSKAWLICQKTLKRVYTNAKIFDTICNATFRRQSEAEALSKRCDVMVVVGGKKSSNTRKLAEVCEPNAVTYHIETAEELPKAEELGGVPVIGVTAGASTPAWIIKEVVETMSEMFNSTEGNENEKAPVAPENAQETGAENSVGEENAKKSFDEMTFEEALEASLNNLNTDQKVKGVVMSIGPTEIQVDIGRKHAGFVPLNELSNDAAVKPEDICKVGDTIDLIVMRTNDQEGTVMLSKRRFDSKQGWDDIVAAKDSEDILEGTVTEVIKGGVIVVSNGVRVFVPASQATMSRNEPLEDMLRTKVKFRIIEINRGRRAVGSIRSVARELRKEQEKVFWETAEVGKIYTGKVKSITSYGAFVDLGGVDGMVHISELSWVRIKHPSEVINVGDTVEVFIKDIDTEKKKISLGYKKTEDNPWEVLKRDYPVGSVVPATIVNMAAYGAFANILPGIDGLIHISQIADRRIEKPQDVLKIGDKMNVKITDIDFDKKRVSLSIRALLEDESAAEEGAPPITEPDAVVASTDDAQKDVDAPETQADVNTPPAEQSPDDINNAPAE